MSDLDPTRVDQPTVFASAGGGPPTQALPPVGGGPAGPPPDRRTWILVGVLGAIVVVLIAILALRGNGDDTEASADSTSTTATSSTTSTSLATTTTTAATTTTAPTTTTSPVVTVPPAQCAAAGNGPNKPGLAAVAVYDAWVRGDEACAAKLMTPSALADLFSRDGTGANQDFQGCTSETLPDPHTDCAFTYEGGSTHYLMHYGNVDGWRVYQLDEVAD